MDPALSQGLVIAGGIITLGLSAVGSALGTGVAGSAAVGAWKKCYAQGKPAPFTLLTFVGAPFTQTLYGMILMILMFSHSEAPSAGIPCILIGVFAGLGIGASAIMQGRCAAAAADAQAETGKGFTNYLVAIGIVETVAIFTMVLALLGILKFKV
jgi:V/A-type H+-transporting ATPase subunit K